MHHSVIWLLAIVLDHETKALLLRMLPINARLNVAFMVNLLLLVRSVFFETMDESVLLEAMLFAFALPVLPVAAILLSVLVPCRCACLQFSSLLLIVLSHIEI